MHDTVSTGAMSSRPAGARHLAVGLHAQGPVIAGRCDANDPLDPFAASSGRLEVMVTTSRRPLPELVSVPRATICPGR